MALLLDEFQHNGNNLKNSHTKLSKLTALIKVTGEFFFSKKVQSLLLMNEKKIRISDKLTMWSSPMPSQENDYAHSNNK